MTLTTPPAEPSASGPGAAAQQLSPAQAAQLQRALKRPATKALVAINVAYFLLMCVSGVSPMQPSNQDAIKWGANFGPLTLGPQPWRLISSSFEHFGVMHIALNMWCLWSLGWMVEMMMGSDMLVILYLLTGTSGALLSLAWRPVGISAGASGAIFGIAGALIAMIYLRDRAARRQSEMGGRKNFNVVLKNLLYFAGLNLLIGFRIAGVDNMAHLGGLIGGLGMGALMARGLRTPPAERRAGWLRLSLAGAVVLVAAYFALATRHAATVRLYAASVDIQKQDFAHALAELDRVPARNRTGEIFIERGYAEFNLKQYPAAEADYQQALKLEGGNADAMGGLADVYVAENQPQRAEKLAQAALSKPDLPAEMQGGLYDTLGEAALAQGRGEEAQDSFARAAQLSPADPIPAFHLGQALLKAGQAQPAIGALREAIRRGKNDAEAHQALAAALIAAGQKNEAAAENQKAAELGRR